MGHRKSRSFVQNEGEIGPRKVSISSLEQGTLNTKDDTLNGR